MSWRERDYSQSAANRYGRRGRRGASAWLPPPASLFLLLAHTAAFALARGVLASGGRSAAVTFGLSAENANPVGILSHPFAIEYPAQFALIVLGIWILASRIEHVFGPYRVLALYLVGNVAAGAGYWLLLTAWPASGLVKLDAPVGALAAWAVVVWRHLSFERLVLLGRSFSLRTATLVAGGVAVAVCISGKGAGALAWLGALGAGGASSLVLDRVWLGSGDFEASGSRGRARRIAALRAAEAEDDEAAIDDILEKISREGLDHLTPDERARLEAARRAMLRKSH